MRDDWLIDSLAECGLTLEIADAAAVDEIVGALRPNAESPRTESRGDSYVPQRNFPQQPTNLLQRKISADSNARK